MTNRTEKYKQLTKEQGSGIYPPKLLYQLFETMVFFVLNAGGDGDGWLVSPHYIRYAKLFEEYEHSTGKDEWFVDSNGTETIVSFSNAHEAIYFVSPDYPLPPWAGDIVVRIY